MSSQPQIASHTEAIDLLDHYLASGNAAMLAPYIRAMSDDNAEAVFAIMQGSGNEMAPFVRLLGLLGVRGLIDTEEALDYIRRYRSRAS